MGRRAGVIVTGAVVGLIAGASAPVVFVAACVWDGRTEWSKLTDSGSVLAAAVLTALGTVNGAAGAWDGWRSSSHRVWPVVWAPALLFLLPAVELVRYPSDSKSWGAALLVVGIVAPFVWAAGRVGQEVGVRGRSRRAEPNTAPEPDV